MRDAIVWGLIAIALGYAALCLIAWAWQGRMVWFPGPPPEFTPEAIGARFDDLILKTKDGVRIHAWHLHAERPRGAVLVSHGNAGNIANRLELARAFLALDCDVVLYDYRGYGKSEGEPTEEGTYKDGEAALDYLATQGFETERVVHYGESLGGAVAIELAVRRGAAAVVVENAFASLADIGAEVYPWLPVRFLSRVKYASVEKLPRLAAPLLVLHSPDDELVGIEHGRRLVAARGGSARLVETGGTHAGGGFLNFTAARAELARFLAASLPAHDQAHAR